MKYMLILKATDDTESGAMPTDEDINAMGRYNQEMIEAGIMLAGEGLYASSQSARVGFSGDAREVTDGPFAETKELIAGFWIIETTSLEEAVEWTRRAPLTEGSIEVRRVMTMEDFNPENEYVQKEKDWREEHGEGRTA